MPKITTKMHYRINDLWKAVYKKTRQFLPRLVKKCRVESVSYFYRNEPARYQGFFNTSPVILVDRRVKGFAESGWQFTDVAPLMIRMII